MTDPEFLAGWSNRRQMFTGEVLRVVYHAKRLKIRGHILDERKGKTILRQCFMMKILRSKGFHDRIELYDDFTCMLISVKQRMHWAIKRDVSHEIAHEVGFSGLGHMFEESFPASPGAYGGWILKFPFCRGSHHRWSHRCDAMNLLHVPKSSQV